MRADRLVAVLLLLQRRGRVTVAQIADELEISERTARRDLEALATAGISVYSTPGRGGGWQLLGDARTDLSGLNEREAHALFLVAGPAADATPQLKAALRKLVRALPEPLRDSAERAGSSVVVDPSEWGLRAVGGPPPPPHLAAVQAAVLGERRVLMTYGDRTGAASERVVDPWGLVAKGSRWYLVAGTDQGRRTFRVDRIRAVVETGERAERPVDFDLGATWAAIADGVDELRTPVRAEVLVDPDVHRFARYRFGARLRELGDAPDGRVRAEVRGPSVRELASLVAGFGGAIEVVDHAELRVELASLGAELVERYRDALTT